MYVVLLPYAERPFLFFEPRTRRSQWSNLTSCTKAHNLLQHGSNCYNQQMSKNLMHYGGQASEDNEKYYKERKFTMMLNKNKVLINGPKIPRLISWKPCRGLGKGGGRHRRVPLGCGAVTKYVCGQGNYMNNFMTFKTAWKC